MKLMENRADLFRRCVHDGKRIEFDDNSGIVIHVHQTMHGSSEWYVHLVVLVADIQPLAALGQDADHGKRNTINQYPAVEWRCLSEQVIRNRMPQHCDARYRPFLGSIKKFP